MENRKQPKIEAIFPLTYMQQGLLFHHLSSEWDQGFLHLECRLKGVLDRGCFEDAWQKIAQRHPALRTTVEWEGLDKAVQVTHGHKPMIFSYHNWTAHNPEQKSAMLEALKEENRNSGANLRTAPLSHIILIKLAKDEHLLLWPIHHLLIDGWSSHIVLGEVIRLYTSLIDKEVIHFEPLPSQRSYYKWLNEQSSKKSEGFWQNYFKDFQEPVLFNRTGVLKNPSQPRHYSRQLGQEISKGLTEFAKAHKVTPNAVVLAIWGTLLGQYFDRQEVVFGTTVSGRSGDFPNINLLAGMFMNIQPVKISIEETRAWPEWLKEIQQTQLKAREYEALSLDEIKEYVGWPVAGDMFDSLFIFENYPTDNSRDAAIQVSEVKSGITSTFPLTLVVIPGNELHLKLSVLPEVIDEHLADWFLNGLEVLLKGLSLNQFSTIGGLKEASELENAPRLEVGPTTRDETIKPSYQAPRNETELRLLQLWEAIFGHDKIGVHDNFFDLGGKSLMAVRLFAKINEKFQQKIPPTTILQFPTISKLSRFILGEEKSTETDWKNLVPIRASGFKKPLFCLHAGGGHVFFYSPLAAYMEESRPIYALQPSGIFGKDKFHESIEEMAEDYVKEIRKVQTKGPYNILVYCFSTALGLEMSKLFTKLGESSNLIVMDTMTDQDQLLTKQRFKMRFYGFVNRLLKNPFKVVRYMVGDRITTHVKPRLKQWFGKPEEKNAERIRVHLEKIYNNYQWDTYPGEVTLILTPKADKRFNEELIRSWSLVAKGGVKVAYTQGEHRSIFEAPGVAHAAKVIEECCV